MESWPTDTPTLSLTSLIRSLLLQTASFAPLIQLSDVVELPLPTVDSLSVVQTLLLLLLLLLVLELVEILLVIWSDCLSCSSKNSWNNLHPLISLLSLHWPLWSGVFLQKLFLNSFRERHRGKSPFLVLEGDGDFTVELEEGNGSSLTALITATDAFWRADIVVDAAFDDLLLL